MASARRSSNTPGMNSRSTPSASASTSSQRPVASFRAMLKSRIKQPQFYWFLGHFFTLYHFIRFHLAFFSSTSQRYHYKMVLFNISITYGIVLYQFYKSGQLKLTPGNLKTNLKTLDNLQYFIMLTSLLFCSMVSDSIVINGATYSPVIYSLFHCLNYFKENLLPFLPINDIFKNVINSRITLFISTYNEQFLSMAQIFEIICCLRSGLFNLPICLVKLLVNFNLTTILNIVSILIYVWFFKLRYLQSERIRNITGQYVLKFEQILASRLPPNLMTTWNTYKQIVSTLFWKLPA